MILHYFQQRKDLRLPAELCSVEAMMNWIGAYGPSIIHSTEQSLAGAKTIVLPCVVQNHPATE